MRLLRHIRFVLWLVAIMPSVGLQAGYTPLITSSYSTHVHTPYSNTPTQIKAVSGSMSAYASYNERSAKRMSAYQPATTYSTKPATSSSSAGGSILTVMFSSQRPIHSGATIVTHPVQGMIKSYHNTTPYNPVVLNGGHVVTAISLSQTAGRNVSLSRDEASDEYRPSMRAPGKTDGDKEGPDIETPLSDGTLPLLLLALCFAVWKIKKSARKDAFL